MGDESHDDRSTDAVPLVLQAIPHFSALGKEIVVRVENEEAGEVLVVRHVVVRAEEPPWKKAVGACFPAPPA